MHHDRKTETSVAWVRLAEARLLSRRLTRDWLVLSTPSDTIKKPPLLWLTDPYRKHIISMTLI
jgi:hypothetical protein